MLENEAPRCVAVSVNVGFDDDWNPREGIADAAWAVIHGSDPPRPDKGATARMFLPDLAAHVVADQEHWFVRSDAREGWSRQLAVISLLLTQISASHDARPVRHLRVESQWIQAVVGPWEQVLDTFVASYLGRNRVERISDCSVLYDLMTIHGTGHLQAGPMGTAQLQSLNQIFRPLTALPEAFYYVRYVEEVNTVERLNEDGVFTVIQAAIDSSQAVLEFLAPKEEPLP